MNNVKVNAILATSETWEIGHKNKLLAKLPKDLEYFKKVTDGHIVIMGRKTFDSLPEANKPLPGRVNFVISRQEGSEYWEEKFDSVESAILKAKELAMITGQKIFIIGGGSIYDYCLENGLLDVIYLTTIGHDFGANYNKEDLVYLKNHKMITKNFEEFVINETMDNGFLTIRSILRKK